MKLLRFLKISWPLFLCVLISLTGCSVGSPDPPPPPIPIPTLTPTPQPFRTRTTFVDNVLSVDVRYHDGRTRTLDTVRHLDGDVGAFPPPTFATQPFQP